MRLSARARAERPRLDGSARRRSLGLLVLGLLVLAACGARQPGQRPKIAVGDLSLTGVRSVDADELRGGLGLVRARELGQEFSGYLVALDRERIRGFYYRRGYFAAEVTSQFDRHVDRVNITFAIVEGPRAKLVRVDVIGLPQDAPISEAQLRDEIPLRDGDPFDYETYDLARPATVTALQEQGYAAAQVTGLVLADRLRAEAVIRLTVELGVRSTFGPITIEGIDGELETSVRTRLRFAEGEPYSPSKLEDTRADLYDYGRFALVRIEPDPVEETATVPVRITLATSPPNELRLGGGVGVNPISYEVRGQAVYGRAGWPTTLTNTRLEFRPALVIQRDDRRVQPRLDAIAGLDRLDLWLPRVRGTAEAAFTYLALEAYTDYGPRLRLGVRFPLAHRAIQISLGWQLQLLKFIDLDAAIDDATAQRLGLDSVERVGFYEQAATIELRDNPLAPERGLYGEVRIEEGTSAAGGAFTYVRVVPDLRGYYSMGPLTFAVRGRLGLTFGDSPVTQRFFAGGATSQRAFSERQLAPFASTVSDTGVVRTAAYGGRASVEINAELRFPLFTIRELPIGGVAFVDSADVTERSAELDLGDLHVAVGGGLRVQTPIGAVRLDLGVRTNRYGAGEPEAGNRYAYHLSIGEAF